MLEDAWSRVTDRDAKIVVRPREGVEEHFGVSILPEGFELDVKRLGAVHQCSRPECG